MSQNPHLWTPKIILFLLQQHSSWWGNYKSHRRIWMAHLGNNPILGPISPSNSVYLSLVNFAHLCLRLQQVPAWSIHNRLEEKGTYNFHIIRDRNCSSKNYRVEEKKKKQVFFKLSLLNALTHSLGLKYCWTAWHVMIPLWTTQNSERMNILCVYRWDEEYKWSLFCMITSLPFFTQSYYLQKSTFHEQTQTNLALSHDFLTLFMVITLFLLFSFTPLPRCVCRISHTDLEVSLNITPIIH